MTNTTAVSDKEKTFWNWFITHKEAFYFNEKNPEDLFDKLTEQLKAVHENLTFEFSPVHPNGIKELTISADGIKAAFPAVISLIKSAPEDKNWQFNAFRQRVPGDHLEISMGNLKMGYDDIYFRFAEDDDKIGLELNIRAYDPNNNTIKNAVFILLDALIGEYAMETKIGWMDWVELDGANMDELMPLVELRTIIDEMDPG